MCSEGIWYQASMSGDILTVTALADDETIGVVDLGMGHVVKHPDKIKDMAAIIQAVNYLAPEFLVNFEGE